MADPIDDTAEAEAEAGGGKKKMIMLGGGALVLLAIGIFAGPAIQNMISPPDDDAAAEAEQAALAEAPGDELYQPLHPALIVNVTDQLGEPHFIQIEMEVMARDQDTINAIKDHMPLIRNNLILLYGTAKYETVITRAGKEQMLADGLAAVREILEPRIKTPNAEALYFTSLVIQ
ncbi:MAG: hypothetical protein HKN35_13230 [Woeseia sp.]|nr:flagellar basal body-associated FliL family protein [Woeseia sp.]MBT8096497.1 flagellar basal body-associated FliL family protein [Woeseia sp.]NNE61851.1 hypothetical protein [Woeseia sp.]NNL53736.1 hypothetical protein [Woeseia sp.]